MRWEAPHLETQVACNGGVQTGEYFTLPPESSTDASTGLGTDWSLLGASTD